MGGVDRWIDRAGEVDVVAVMVDPPLLNPPSHTYRHAIHQPKGSHWGICRSDT